MWWCLYVYLCADFQNPTQCSSVCWVFALRAALAGPMVRPHGDCPSLCVFWIGGLHSLGSPPLNSASPRITSPKKPFVASTYLCGMPLWCGSRHTGVGCPCDIVVDEPVPPRISHCTNCAVFVHWCCPLPKMWASRSQKFIFYHDSLRFQYQSLLHRYVIIGM